MAVHSVTPIHPPLLCTTTLPVPPGLLAVPLTCLADSHLRHLLFPLSGILFSQISTWLSPSPPLSLGLSFIFSEALLLKTALSEILISLSLIYFFLFSMYHLLTYYTTNLYSILLLISLY